MFYVYVLSHCTGRLNAGVTREILPYLRKHHQMTAPTCTHKHHFDRLLLVERFRQLPEATARQAQINRCTLTEKLEIIRAANPRFDDLSPELSLSSM